MQGEACKGSEELVVFHISASPGYSLMVPHIISRSQSTSHVTFKQLRQQLASERDTLRSVQSKFAIYIYSTYVVFTL